MRKELTEEQKVKLKTVVDHFDKEDRAVRERQIRTWRRLKLFWEGFQQTWYSEVAHDWRIWDQETSEDSDQSYYDKPVNIFRAYLESIIAALSVTVPPVKCYPDDADDELDLSTAQAGDKIAQLIYRHNDVSLLWLHALFIYCTEGMVAYYSYPKDSKEYGTYQKKTYRDDTEEHEYVECPLCGYQMSDEVVNQADELHKLEHDEFMPDDEDAALHAAMNEYAGQDICPSCSQLMDPAIRRETLIVTKLIGTTSEPKSRVCLEAYGGLYIKVPNYARTQAECPYLEYSYECNVVIALERYECLRGSKSKLREKVKSDAGGVYDPYEAWGRLSPQYRGEYPLNTITMRHMWLRPCAFNVLDDEKDVAELKKLFPDGCKATYANDEFADAENEALDDCWTLTYNPLSDYVHCDPLGLLLTSVQEITNDLISLTLQTVEHGIPQTFADPAVLNFNAYQQTEAVPGGIYPATPKSGKGLAEGFHEVKTATLSQEVIPFTQNVQSLGQLVSGALPSLFGGQLEGSETASQYSMSRSQALQRLQNTWKMFTSAWKQVFGKAVPMFIKVTVEDERDVQRNSHGGFINVFIRQAEMQGKIGRVELEANENLPLTWSQRKDVVMQLLQAANPQILEIISAPENLSIIHEAIGLDDFFVPGEDDKTKQYAEIKQLVNSEPITVPAMDPMTGQQTEQEYPSVEIEPDIDNNAIEFEICRAWLVSEAGRQCKVDNEAGYKNVLLHARMHMQVIQQQQMEQQMAMQESKGAANPEKPNKLKTQEAPITGENDVKTI